MKIRTAKIEDVKTIMELDLSLFKKWDKIDRIDQIDRKWFESDAHHKRIIDSINDSSKKIILAFENDKCIGYIKAEVLEREPFLKKVGYVSEMYILEEYRNKHIGSKLLKNALTWFKKNNLCWTTVSTHSLDKDAIGFWEKKGYKEYNKFFKMKIQ